MAKLINNKWVFTDAELDDQIKKAKELDAIESKKEAPAAKWSFDKKLRSITIRFNDGFAFTFPAASIKELRSASAKEIASGQLTPGGDAIHWDNLDAHYTIAGLAANRFGSKEWMKELAKKGGSTSTPAKASAARLNGMKGGRPAKQKVATAGYYSRSTAKASAAKPPAKKSADTKAARKRG